MKNLQKPRKSKLCTTFEAEILIIEIKFYKGAKRLGGERESGRNDSGANGKATRGRNDGEKGKVGETIQGRTGKWAKRFRGERESGRNDPDSATLSIFYELKGQGSEELVCKTF